MSDSWQWTAQALVALSGLIATVLVVRYVARRRPSEAASALGAAVFIWLVWGAVVVTGGPDTSFADAFSHPLIWLPYALMILGGALAIAIERRSQRDRQDGSGQSQTWGSALDQIDIGPSVGGGASVPE